MPRLVLVATPIGNLEDITLRALRVLKEADLIVAEDTRHASKLLQHYGISKPLLSLHQHNEHWRVPQLIKRIISEDLLVAAVSDAGTPGIADPGFLLVRTAVSQHLTVEVLPGPCAFLPALVGSGLPCERFVFEGFLPPKKGRVVRLQALSNETRTFVLYEAPHRLIQTLSQLIDYLGGERAAVVARELTKIHESFTRGTLAEIKSYFESHPPKGECVIVVAGKS
ncbi:MAG: 16S rRNA (cytidine(1402)-2'-O)-methyltransferase [Bacteroidia bacterium]|nr:16S rRNA (cytidine(1402)-2'-O)-methyltransferase [Bacteroidia bacterium]MDW8158160.1 16S rRNA (cytidine(1402)-2'-O)-methyltransferase [Bacteroidia bacterium]